MKVGGSTSQAFFTQGRPLGQGQVTSRIPAGKGPLPKARGSLLSSTGELGVGVEDTPPPPGYSVSSVLVSFPQSPLLIVVGGPSHEYGRPCVWAPDFCHPEVLLQVVFL